MLDKKLLNITTVLFLAVLMAALDIAIIGPALPAIQQSFSVNDDALSWVFGIYILFQLLGAPIIAKLSDRYGRRKTFFYCVAFFGFSSLIVAASSNFYILLIGRSLQGFSAGGILPVSTAIIADSFPAKHRGKALGLIGAVFGLAFLLGPILGALLLNFGWNWLFIINIPIVIYVCLQSLRFLPNDKATRPSTVDLLGAFFLFLTLTSFAYAISQIDSASLSSSLMSNTTVTLFIIFLISFMLFIFRENTAKDPIISLEILGSKQLVIIWCIAIVTGLVEAGMVFLPSVAVNQFNVLDTTASLMLLPLVAALIIGSLVSGILSDNLSPIFIIQISLALLIFSFLFFSYSNLSYSVFYIAGMIIGLSIAGIMTALRVLLISSSSKNNRGSNQGILALFLSIGRLIGASLVGAVMASEINSVVGFQKALLVTTGLIGIALIVSANLKFR